MSPIDSLVPLAESWHSYCFSLSSLIPFLDKDISLRFPSKKRVNSASVGSAIFPRVYTEGNVASAKKTHVFLSLLSENWVEKPKPMLSSEFKLFS